MSVTSGVVSRIELQEYSQSGESLLAIQIDAAINSGNSGGPVVDGTNYKVVGVAFQTLEEAENIGYVVPVTIIQHFLENVRLHDGKFEGFCSLGTSFASLENSSMRSYLQLKETKGGILVNALNPTSHAVKVLETHDVILSVDGMPIDTAGNIPFRNRERVHVSAYIQTKFPGETVSLDLIRNGACLKKNVLVGLSSDLVPSHYNNRSPPYMIVAGLIFTPLSMPFLQACEAWDEYSSDNVLHLANQYYAPLRNEGDQLIVLSQVLAHSANLGYDELSYLLLEKVNGEKVRSLRHLYFLVKNNTQAFLKMEFSPSRKIVVLDASTLTDVTKEVCQQHGIRLPFSIDGVESINTTYCG